MQGVVMAGGQGERLRPLTLTEPKPFLPVAGRPVIEWGMLALARAGITDVIVTTAYKKEVLQRHLGDGEALGVSIRYAEEKDPLGTAGGVKNAEHLIDGPFVVMSADVVSDVDLGKLVAFHAARGAKATIGLTTVEDVSQFGIVVTDENGTVTRFQEKPKREEAFSDTINAGIYVCDRDLLDEIPKYTKYDFSRDLWPRVLGRGLFGAPVEGYWKDVGHPADLIRANLHQAARIGQDRFGEVEVAADAAVEDSVLMDGASVGAGARVTRSLVLPGAVVGAGAHVTDSVVGWDAHVGDRVRLEDVVLGARVVVPEDQTVHGERIGA